MLLDKPVQVIDRDVMFFHDLGGDLVPCFDSFRLFAELLEIASFTHRSCRCPNQLCIACILFDGRQKLQESFLVLVFAVTPTMKTVVEVNGGELVVLQQKLNFVGERQIGDTLGCCEPSTMCLWAHGWSYLQIARALRMSPATAWRRVHDLKRRLGIDHVT